MFLIFIVIGLLIYYYMSNNTINLPGKMSAEDKLKERFVNGEIDEAKYLQMLNTLKG